MTGGKLKTPELCLISIALQVYAKHAACKGIIPSITIVASNRPLLNTDTGLKPFKGDYE